MVNISTVMASVTAEVDVVGIFEKVGVPVGVLLVIITLFIYEQKASRAEREDHRAERREWRESSEKIQDRNIQALERLTEAIRESSRGSGKGL